MVTTVKGGWSLPAAVDGMVSSVLVVRAYMHAVLVEAATLIGCLLASSHPGNAHCTMLPLPWDTWVTTRQNTKQMRVTPVFKPSGNAHF